MKVTIRRANPPGAALEVEGRDCGVAGLASYCAVEGVPC